MLTFDLSPAAKQDIVSILLWTYEKFGKEARHRYEMLLKQAIYDIARDPECIGSLSRPEFVKSARTYHLSFSRNRVFPKALRVKQPRHFVIYRVNVAEGILEIARVLHDTMDLLQHLPDDYIAPS